MGDGTGISWTDATWNPTLGCTHVGPECNHCYAAREASGRLRNHPLYQGLAYAGKFTGKINLVAERLDQPLRWQRPRRVFVNSMSDLFHKGVPTQYVAEVFAVMVLAQWHTFQVLTKRPKRMRDLMANPEFAELVDTERRKWVLPHRVMQRRLFPPDTWPPPNVWLGTSIGVNRNVWRADVLRDTVAAVRFISAEPLLEALPDLDLTGVDWLIVGGESGSHRPMHPEWARDLRDRATTSGVAFHFKQWGDHLPVPIIEDSGMATGRAIDSPRHSGGRDALVIRDGPLRTFRPMRPGDVTAGGVHMLDEQTVVVRVGARRAGNELDGRTWQEYPDERNPTP